MCFFTMLAVKSRLFAAITVKLLSRFGRHFFLAPNASGVAPTEPGDSYAV